MTPINGSNKLHGESRSQPSGTQTQATALRSEGVQVQRSALGELTVDFGDYGWFPKILPSEDDCTLDEDDEEDEGEDGDADET